MFLSYSEREQQLTVSFSFFSRGKLIRGKNVNQCGTKGFLSFCLASRLYQPLCQRVTKRLCFSRLSRGDNSQTYAGVLSTRKIDLWKERQLVRNKRIFLSFRVPSRLFRVVRQLRKDYVSLVYREKTIATGVLFFSLPREKPISSRNNTSRCNTKGFLSFRVSSKFSINGQRKNHTLLGRIQPQEKMTRESTKRSSILTLIISSTLSKKNKK